MALRAFFVLVVVVAMAGCLSPGDDGPPTAPEGVTCEWARVRSVTDGDTIRVDFDDGPDNQAVRYIGIDTPELRPPDGPEPFGEDASDRNSELVGGERVCLERDVSETDRFGRLLRYVWLEDGSLVNEVLVQEGLASAATFPPDVKYQERLRAAEKRARGSESGIWGD